MTKLIWLVALACIGWRLLSGKWPWAYLASRKKSRDSLALARSTLGVSVNATRQEILDAHRKLVAKVHPDKGGTNAGVHAANNARDTLLNNLPFESRDQES